MVPKNKLQTESSSRALLEHRAADGEQSNCCVACHGSFYFRYFNSSLLWPAACAKASNVLPLNYDFLFGDDCSHLAHFNSPGSARNSQIRVQSPRMCPLPVSGKLETSRMAVVPFARPAETYNKAEGDNSMRCGNKCIQLFFSLIAAAML